jgi:hypothetical protein
MSKYDNFNINNRGNINKIVMGDVNKTIINNYNLLPKRLSKKEREEKEKITKRPCLRDKLGQKITCFGYIVGKHKYLRHLYTIVNVVDITGEFAADHIQLNFKEDIYDYTYDKGSYIRFTGVVVAYERKSNGSIDYTVDISKKVMIMSGDYDVLEEYIPKRKICDDDIDDYLCNQNITKIQDIILNIRNEINDITNGLFFEDYLYYYVLNQYMLNQATYSIYQGELRDQNINEDCVIGILILLASLLYELKTEDSYIGEIMSNISIKCNVLQGITEYTCYENNPGLQTFYQDIISNTHQQAGKKLLKYMFNFIANRFYDFNHKTPNDKSLTVNDIKQQAYPIIECYL